MRQGECNDVAAGGVILGDLPPYEAFPIGGTNSVRGYSEGGVGSGRNYIAGTTALQWPIFGPVEVITPARPVRLTWNHCLLGHERINI